MSRLGGYRWRMAALAVAALVVGAVCGRQGDDAIAGNAVNNPPRSGGSGLTPIADQTALCNVSGSTAIPTACTASQVNTMLGTVAPEIRFAYWAFFKSRYANLRTDAFSDFVVPSGTVDWTTLLSTGTASWTQSPISNRGGGVIALTSGAGPGTSASLGLPGMAANGGQVIKSKTGGSWGVACTIVRTTAIDATSQLSCQLTNWATAGVAIWGINGATSTTNMAYSVNGGTTWTATSVPIATALPLNTWTALEIGFDGTTVSLFYGDPQLGTPTLAASTTAISSLPDIVATSVFRIGQTASSAQNVGAQCDSLYVAVQ